LHFGCILDFFFHLLFGLVEYFLVCRGIMGLQEDVMFHNHTARPEEGGMTSLSIFSWSALVLSLPTPSPGRFCSPGKAELGGGMFKIMIQHFLGKCCVQGIAPGPFP
jgi:hypothetical protein